MSAVAEITLGITRRMALRLGLGGVAAALAPPTGAAAGATAEAGSPGARPGPVPDPRPVVIVDDAWEIPQGRPPR